MVGDVRGKRTLLVDDEISTGGTVCSAAATLIEHGARDVSVAVVHPVFSGPAVERLRSAPIAEVVVTDSIPLPPHKQDPKFKVLTIAPLVAEAISRVHDGRSVSELFDGGGR
jgi:ribose-phosphate pyrophosphokinase